MSFGWGASGGLLAPLNAAAANETYSAAAPNLIRLHIHICPPGVTCYSAPNICSRRHGVPELRIDLAQRRIMPPTLRKSEERPYHHGDLPRVIVKAALEILRETQSLEFSLRELA